MVKIGANSQRLRAKSQRHLKHKGKNQKVKKWGQNCNCTSNQGQGHQKNYKIIIVGFKDNFVVESKKLFRCSNSWAKFYIANKGGRDLI